MFWSGRKSWRKKGESSGKDVPRNPLHSLLENLLDIWLVLTVFLGLILGTERSRDRRSPTGLDNRYWGPADGASGTYWRVASPESLWLLPACSLAVQGNEKREIATVRPVLPAVGARTSYLSRRSAGIWGWAAWAFCWVRISLPRFPAARPSPALGFFVFRFYRGAFAELGSCCASPLPRGGCFSQVLSESRHHRCHASVCSSVLCLVTTKTWSDGH